MYEQKTYCKYSVDKIASALDDYKQGAKIKNLGIICKVISNYNCLLRRINVIQGGPGHLYLFANKPVTPVKLVKDHKMMTYLIICYFDLLITF